MERDYSYKEIYRIYSLIFNLIFSRLLYIYSLWFLSKNIIDFFHKMYEDLRRLIFNLNGIVFIFFKDYIYIY